MLFEHVRNTNKSYRDVNKLVELIKTSRTSMANFAKAKTAKIGMVPDLLVR